MPIPANLRFDRVLKEDYVAMLEALTAGSFYWDPQEDRVEWSPRLHECLGYDPQSAHLAEAFELIHPDDNDRHLELLGKSRENAGTYEDEIRLKDVHGQYQHFVSRGYWIKGDNGQAQKLIGFVIAITETARLRQEAARSERLLRSFLDNAPAAAFIKDRHYNHLYGNENAARLAGVTLDEFLARKTSEIFDPEMAAILAETDDRVLETGETMVWKGPLKDANGEIRHIIDTKFPVEDRITGEIMLGGFGLDITSQHEAEKALERAQRLETVGQLVAGVAHDFNNILAVIGGNLELLGEALEGDDLDMRRNALNAVEKGAKLTRQLLAYARQAHLETEIADLNVLVRDADHLFRRTLPENIEIRAVLGAGLWSTKIDVAQAESALLNLALNARDAMPHGGRLTIETCNVSIDRQYIDERQEDLAPGHYVLLAVSDTGTGMPQTVLERAFDPFFTTKPVGKGTGMGLSMVHGLMRQFDGAVRIYSEEGVGTSVKLYFPAVKQVPDARTFNATSEIPDGDEHVLLVEDDAGVRHVLERQLASLGYSVTVAANGDAALSLIREGIDIELLLTDIVMPGSLMGNHLARRARALRPGLPVVFMSGYPAEATVHGSGLDPDDRILMKPASRAVLARALREVLDGADSTVI